MNSVKKHSPKIFTTILYALLFVALVFLMQHVQKLLASDVKINLTEIVSQNKDVITSKFNLEVNNLGSIADQLVDRVKDDPDNFENVKTVFTQYIDEKDKNNLFISDTEGKAHFPSGEVIDISCRKYFKLAIEGIQNISDKTTSRLDGEDVFIVSAPLRNNDDIIGTIQKFYTPKEMYEICSVSLFSSDGYIYIINNEGYILLSSQYEEHGDEMDNYFRLIYSQGNTKESEQLQNDIKENHQGFMETVIDGEKMFSAYTPIEDIHDWYLISSVNKSAVSENAGIVIKMFYFILSAVVVIFGISLFCFLSYKNKQQENLKKIAFEDAVTEGDTYNKFINDLTTSLNEFTQKQFYILKFDIDNFKYVNNFYGFNFGDRVLKKIYHNVAGFLLPNEYIARVYSDHFVIAIENAESQRLEEIFSSINEVEGVSIYYSAGLYKITNKEENINLMVDKASTAAASVKGYLHREIGIYTEEFEQTMIRNERLKRLVKQALLNGEIIPYYQSKVDVNSGKLVGVEALARWKLEDGRVITPNEFIPICESTGMIKELDMVIYENVLQLQKRNIEKGVKCLPISINFSRLHLLDKNFFDKLLILLKKYEIPSDLVEIELTESAIFENYETITNFISQLHAEGLKVSMDDFGSGYSSLNMLKDIDIDVLKIDKEFLNKTMNSERQRIIFTAIVQMANQLKIKVVVEGVEVIEHVNLMKEAGCSIAQGYFYAKPIDEESFEKIYKEGVIC